MQLQGPQTGLKACAPSTIAAVPDGSGCFLRRAFNQTTTIATLEETPLPRASFFNFYQHRPAGCERALGVCPRGCVFPRCLTVCLPMRRKSGQASGIWRTGSSFSHIHRKGGEPPSFAFFGGVFLIHPRVL